MDKGSRRIVPPLSSSLPSEMDTTSVAGFFCILLNALTRSIAPSAYVPASKTRLEWWASPIAARCIATVAEYAFYREEAAAFGLLDDWNDYGATFRLWFFGEMISWMSLLGQSQAFSFIEDSTWAIFHIYVYTVSDSPERYILLPLIAYYLFVHLPTVCKEVDLNWQLLRDVPFTDKIDKTSASWVVPSVLAKVVVFLIFVQVRHVQDTEQLEKKVYK